ncbi:MAG: MauE/DoxX family redox-associated membrane protein [Pseudomonadota bacterium]
MQRITLWALSLFVAVIFVQSTFFKFSGAEETMIIFNTLGAWLSSISLPTALAEAFGHYGAYGVGIAELIAAALILIPATRRYGAALSLLVITGAVFAHLFTPLGVDRVVDAAGTTDGGALFYTALAVWVSSAVILGLSLRQSDARSDHTPAYPETVAQPS